MKKSVIFLYCFVIAITVIFANAISTIDINYYVLTKVLRDQDKQIEDKEFAITKKLIEELRQISIFSEMAENLIDSKKRIEILELQTQELQYQVQQLIDKDKPKNQYRIKTPEEFEQDKIKQKKEEIISNPQSELDIASSDAPSNLKQQ